MAIQSESNLNLILSTIKGDPIYYMHKGICVALFPYNSYYILNNENERDGASPFIECALNVLARCWVGAMVLHHTPLL